MSDIQRFNYALSYWAPRLGFFVQLAILIIAVIAARRHKLGGLWLLAMAAALLGLRDIGRILLPFHTDNPAVSVIRLVLEYMHFLAAFVALCGWCLLAFWRKTGKETET